VTLIERLHQDGFLRLGSKTAGFRYKPAKRGKKPGADDLRRIRSLGLPPAWREVAIHRSPNAKLQAVGRDDAGRWQYRYHPLATQLREDKKLQRLLLFAENLPKLRRRIRHDLRTPGLNHDRVMAALARILLICFLRPGSRVYARENGSFGLCTLRRRHVQVKGDIVHFDFIGKSAQRQVRDHRGKQTARLVRELLKLPGKQLFQYRTDDGQTVEVRRSELNRYIKEVMGGNFTAKDFRTWNGTLLCACALARAECAADAPASVRKKLVRQAIVETASHLGNTPTVCKSSYVTPSVLSHFDQGRVVARYFDSVEQMSSCKANMARACEQALLKLLKDTRKAKKKDVRPEMTKLGKMLMKDSGHSLGSLH